MSNGNDETKEFRINNLKKTQEQRKQDSKKRFSDRKQSRSICRQIGWFCLTICLSTCFIFFGFL